MVEHLLGEMVELGGGGDAKVDEHGIRAPAAKELDGVGVGAGTE